MLITTLKWGEQIRIGDTVLTVMEIRNGPDVRRVRLGFQAKTETVIDRQEIAERKRLDREGGA